MKTLRIFGFEIRKVVHYAPPERMTDAEIYAALCMPAVDPRFRAVMELVQRNVDLAGANAHSERNAARNAQKTAYYCGAAGMAEFIRECLMDAREKAFERFEKPEGE